MEGYVLKKKIYFILIILFILILLFSLYWYQNYKYSLENIKNILNSQDYTYSNAYLTVSTLDLNTNTTITADTYIKDNLSYSISYNNQNEKISEAFLDKANSKRITVLHTEKTVISDTHNNSYIFNPTSSFFDTLNQQNHIEYKYLGKEIFNNQKCLKISLTTLLSDYAHQYCYYISEKDNSILKIENYSGTSIDTLNKYSETTYTYVFDIVTDNDILKLDHSKYPDYNYINSLES